MYSAWKEYDDPPALFQPVPMIILLRAAKLCGDNPRDQAIMDFICMAFYYLLRPGEYANASDDAQYTFRLKDVFIISGAMHIKHAHLATLTQLHAANIASLTFTTQKNGVKGEKLYHASNGQPFACPIRATTRCAAHFIEHSALPNTPLHVYYDEAGRRRAVFSAMITSLLWRQTSPYQCMPASIQKISLLALFEPAAQWLSCLAASIQIKFASSVAGGAMPYSTISMLMTFLLFATNPESYYLAATTALCKVVALTFPPLPP